MSTLVLAGPYILAVALGVAAMIGRNRDLVSTTLFRVLAAAAALLGLGWTALLIALARSDL